MRRKRKRYAIREDRKVAPYKPWKYTNKKIKYYRFYTDYKGDFLAVRFSELERLDLVRYITRMSRMKGGTVYLHYDYDMGKFLDSKDCLGEYYRFKVIEQAELWIWHHPRFSAEDISG